MDEQRYMWIPSSHPISDIRDWAVANHLELRPDFQRNEVWSAAARIMLMDTIIRNIPMPKVFLTARIVDRGTFRSVIDGQQRLKTILDFLRDEFALRSPYKGPHSGLKFSALPQSVQDDILQYKIDVNEIRNASEDVLREIYSRVNKYIVPLNKQELRVADFPGDFLNSSRNLAASDHFSNWKMFSVPQIRRQLDIEFISELLVILISDINDKKSTLDQHYQDYMEWHPNHRHAIENSFKSILTDIDTVFSDNSLANSRFKQKADFYSLFAAVHTLKAKEQRSLESKDLSPLMEDLKILDLEIGPDSDVDLCRAYAVRCVSDANSASSRRWRREFLLPFLRGTYCNDELPSQATVTMFREILVDFYYPSMCPPTEMDCSICGATIENLREPTIILTWFRTTSTYQLSNAVWIHQRCAENDDRFIISFPESDQPVLSRDDREEPE